ncbi:leucyl/phenylalanyl-tRNA--protein transferase [Pedobacter sp. B4-66]|uniref:leucyl/phenylalanyl-tRNA--protein transferase n=1 Tax=Pedobacter sp. B4-66 TaxID=2817280 RepID=UPI001BDA2041|nr:leucyl/phenylalanyl-tRNA--protein transferase [Pedobacter sp. B4-66]
MGVVRKVVSSVIPSKLKAPTMRMLQKLFHAGLVNVSGGQEEALFWASAQIKLSPYMVFQGFLQGAFPMPKVNDNKIFTWYDPDPRGVIPINDFKLSSDILRLVRKNRLQEADKRFEIKVNTNFELTLKNCSKPRGEKMTAWITPEYIQAILELHRMGLAHSVETYQNGELVGGLVGVALNGYFVGLSLFRTVDNASKIAFYYLLVKLKEDGFKLHLSGAPDSWLTQFGLVKMTKNDFRQELMTAITTPVTFSQRIPELVI